MHSVELSRYPVCLRYKGQVSMVSMVSMVILDTPAIRS